MEKALATLQDIERFACDQLDHVSCAKAWMLMSRGVAHALDYDFRVVPPASDGSAAKTAGRRAETDALGAPWKRCLWSWPGEMRRRQRTGRL